MKNINANLELNPLPELGKNEHAPLVKELREAYLFAGLAPGNALEAAIADYADLFRKAA